MLERFATGSQISRLTGAQAASSLPALIPTLILRLFLPFLLLLATLYLNTAGAQTPPASEPGITPASAAQLADLLENEKTRKQLIEQLRAQRPLHSKRHPAKHRAVLMTRCRAGSPTARSSF